MSSSVGATLEAIKYTRGSLEILDQLLIPKSFIYEVVDTTEKAFHAIRDMKVRGAPAIAIVAVLTLAVEANQLLQSNDALLADASAIAKLFNEKLDRLAESRPTAVNLFQAVGDFKNKIAQSLETNKTGTEIVQLIIDEAEALMNRDIEENAKISECGSDHIISTNPSSTTLKVLTHCNTGALATMKYGTALGVIRFLQKKNVLEHAFCTETRPYNQGARLTAFELVYEKIPSTLICDSAVSYLFKTKKIDAIIVGADRVCNNGDTANKIGTYHIAVSAKHHGIPFYVAAPFTSIDLTLASGDLITIEERSEKEITHYRNNDERAVVENIGVWNPGFDVTTADLISGFFTDIGVFTPLTCATTGKKYYDLKTQQAEKLKQQ
ncbi:predicted protein [Naegleria gruberi]|uniref:Methylthioribose-1-phosphate isomerase n=1 Tax=Naegleria gruberi TaxID=5762 RepID=MTNA_NAEGR|nr:uncharacterized protein NAEGRDRAFT_32363 [Naegleria gruberi]D2VAA9.1 RecName: Full=Methylthioribose-1-phosphate isomerase; Short=M1Pi; Short=MTR-1-P isomerase; AltName: Full=S-methyl-5-thioribose-1-phosphate isomerase; AltName: Full=Translation initiation factor eIF-2B subunit alpha/beta/delta-like protein [Naegleria gruberi]EFC46275.1 predicted protein [Naegleria gruberi]|eukprot:XP_002679019.1 predicted protein [Naegleria gruberi strain NEG-M]